MLNINELKKRLYFFVPYNISPIQQAIQAGHAALEYAFKYGNTKEFIDFVTNHKTWIILNGGTTNDSLDNDGYFYGSLNKILDILENNDINYTIFREPDLNDTLTAVCFICDERVFDWENYPDFKSYLIKTLDNFDKTLLKLTLEDLKLLYPIPYNNWYVLIGGKQNEILKELIKDKKLA
ncbi:MAG: hypothetical protein PHF86_00125 [Candidatus Nanoarchaeia archaeon]|nr:hypothetical protein [Candidatus Nanoarchaeia archaeon]